MCASGTPALTSRGFVEEDFAKVAEFFDSAVKLAVKIKTETQGAYIFYICNFLVIGSVFFGGGAKTICSNLLIHGKMCDVYARNKVEGLLGHNAVFSLSIWNC